jgi:hypothetical protein
MTLSSPRGDRELDGSKITGVPFSFTMTANGRIRNFQNADTLRVPLDMNGPGRSTVRDFIHNFTGSFFGIFPEKPVMSGEIWKYSEKDTLKVGGIELTTEIEWNSVFAGLETVKGIECVKLESTGEVFALGSGDGGRVQLEGEGEITSVTYFDFRNGIIIQRDVEFFSEYTMAMEGQGTSSQSIESTITIEKSGN